MTSDELGISPSDRVMALSARPEALRLKINETILIVVDMQNAYVSRGGYLDLAGFDISDAAAVVEQTHKAIEAAHHAGILVTFLQNGWDANYVEAGGPGSPNWHKSNALKTMRRRPELAGRLLARGSWDYEVVEALKPHEDDIIVSKPRYSGFCNTNLDSLLRARGIRNLVFTGIATNICVESTLRDGFFLEYFGIILSDATGRAGPDFVQKAALYNIETFFGWVSTVAEFTDALEKAGVISPEASHVKRIV